MSEEKTNPAALVTIEGWTLATDADEARVRDLDLAERLQYPRPRDIRKLIARMEEEGEIADVLVRATVARGRNQHGETSATQTVEEYWLTEEQALLVAARSAGPALLAAWRKKREITQHEAAKLLGFSQSAISSWECGRSTPEIDSAAKIERETSGDVPMRAWATPVSSRRRVAA